MDHSGGGRRLPSERTGDEAEVGGYAEAAGGESFSGISLGCWRLTSHTRRCRGIELS